MARMVARRFDPKSVRLEGLEEISHNILKCSNCKRPLLDVLVTQDVEFTTRFRAECPYCPVDVKGQRERSFPVDIRGFVAIGTTDGVAWDGQDELDDNEGVDMSVLLQTQKDIVR